MYIDQSEADRTVRSRYVLSATKVDDRCHFHDSSCPDALCVMRTFYFLQVSTFCPVLSSRTAKTEVGAFLERGQVGLLKLEGKCRTGTELCESRKNNRCSNERSTAEMVVHNRGY